MSIQLVPLSRLITPSPRHNIRLLSSTQCLSRYTKGCPYKSSTSVLRRWKYHRQRDLVAPPQSSNTEMPERPRLQVLEAVNSSSPVNLRNLRWCQEFHRYGHKVAWGRQKAPRSFGGWWGRREWTMSWSSSSTASLPSPVACSSINTSRSWGWPLDVIATRTRKRHSQFTGLSISLWPTSLFLGCWTLYSRILVQGGRPIQANHRPWYWQTHGRRKRKHWWIWNSGKTDLWTPFSIPKSSKIRLLSKCLNVVSISHRM